MKHRVYAGVDLRPITLADVGHMPAIIDVVDHVERPFKLATRSHDIAGIRQQLRDVLRVLESKDTGIHTKALHPSLQVRHNFLVTLN